MPTGTIVKVWSHDSMAFAAVAVTENGTRTEYIGSTPLTKPDGSDKTNAELKVDLTAAVKAKRDAQMSTPSVVSISGTVTV